MTTEEKISIKKMLNSVKTIITNIEKSLNDSESVGTQRISKKEYKSQKIRSRFVKQFNKNISK